MKISPTKFAHGKPLETLNEADELVDALGPVVEALAKLGVAYYVGGSVASSYHGATRSTMDVDLVSELCDELVDDFLILIDDRFYVSETAVRDAVRRNSCFNLIHLPTSFKVDVFISRRRPFDVESMDRAIEANLGENRQIKVAMATAEDSIISKLEWYRLTDETSERQWDDVSRLVKLLGERADYQYLERAADTIGVSDLLTRLRDQNKK